MFKHVNITHGSESLTRGQTLQQTLPGKELIIDEDQVKVESIVEFLATQNHRMASHGLEKILNLIFCG